MSQEECVNKSELIDAIATASDLSKADSDKALAAVVEAIITAVRSGDKVTIPGFGSFSASERQARTGRNPQTGAVLEIPASKAPKFTAGSAFKAAVNGKS